MKEHPIIFNGQMVQAILEDRKTQTRRPIKRQDITKAGIRGIINGTGPAFGPCPYGEIGDRLWVRETWHPRGEYRATPWENASGKAKWCPSIHMPRWASRLTLEVTGVKVERLQEITEEDAQAEGATGMHFMGGPDAVLYKEHFELLWNCIYAKKGLWWVGYRPLGLGHFIQEARGTIVPK